MYTGFRTHPQICRRHRRLGFLAVSGLLALGACAPVSGPEDLTRDAIVETAKQKNVLVVVLDAAGAKHFGCYGRETSPTPNLDAVARESVVFENAYAQASGTMLSVFSYFTSRYPFFDKDVVLDRDTALHIPGQMTTLAEVMAQRYSHRYGFTCNTWLRREFGHDQGFTDYHHLWDQPADLLRWARRNGRSDVALIPQARDWMTAHADAGFFAYLHFLVPHGPYLAPEPYFSRFTIGNPSPLVGSRESVRRFRGTVPPDTLARNIEGAYEASLAYIDAAVGGMITELKDAGVWDDTIFVLMADHGEAFWEHPPTCGHGGIVYEEVVRVPLVIRIPGVPGLAGRRIAARVELVDLMPTLMDLQDIPVGALQLAGRSLVPLMPDSDTSGVRPSRPIFTQTNRRVPPIFAIIDDDFKLQNRDGADTFELYNLAVDSGEKFDLVPTDEYGPLVEALWAKLENMRERGSAMGTVARTVSTDELDAATRQRLRSLGYIR